MAHPDRPIGNPCPVCGNKLVRRTTNPSKPLGTIVCKTCGFTNPIRDFVNNIQANRIAQAKAKRKAVKAK